MATKSTQAKQRRVFFTLDDGIQQVICVPRDVDDATYKQFKKDVKLLVRWVRFGTEMMTRDWNRINNLPTALRKLLADKGLIEARQTRSVSDFLYALRDERTDLESNTIKAWNTAIKKLVAKFGDMLLHNVTHEKAALFRADLVKHRQSNGEPYSEAYISKLIQLSREFFDEAKNRKLIDENPFQNVETGCQVNKDKWHIISDDEYNGLFLGCGIVYDVACAKAKKNDKAKKNLAFILGLAKGRLIIALGQAGLRIPSELVGLRRSEIDWENNCFVVHSPTTKRKGKSKRIVPIFDLDKPQIKLRQYLLEALKEAPESEERIFPAIQPNSSNIMGKWLRAVAKHGNVALWPDPFKNMRRTCEMALLKNGFHPYECEAWVGHTGDVADKHYRQVTDERIAKAVGKIAATNQYSASKDGYRDDIQFFESPLPSDSDVWKMAVNSGETLASKSCGQLCGFSAAHDIAFNEALQRLNPAAKIVCRFLYGDEPSLGALNHMLLNYGNIKTCTLNGVRYGVENSPENKPEEDTKKASVTGLSEETKWAHLESNQGPRRYQRRALTN